MNHAGESVGHIVTVYNRTATKTHPLKACGITVVTRPEQALAQTDCVVLMLADAAAIRAVLLTPASLAVLRDKTVIQMGTIAQEENLALQAESNESADRIARRRCWEALPKHKPEHSLLWSAVPKNNLSSGLRCSVH
jgi:3-hydroxyisobutyrate dehydrogenase-like beta-hydroxyacid dehydrogenase